MVPTVLGRICVLLGAVLASSVLAAWTTQEAGTRARLFSVDFFSRDSGLACGDSGVLLRTVDGGLSWQRLKAPFGDSGLREVRFLDGRNGVVLSSSGEVARSADGGQTWTRIPDLPVPITALVKRRNTRLFLGNAKSEIRYSDDAGITWAAAEIQGANPTGRMYDMHFPASDTGFALSNQGLFRTTDGGRSWSLAIAVSSSPVFTSSIFQSLFFLSGKEGFLGSYYYARMLRTDDEARSFLKVDDLPVRALYFHGPDTGYVASTGGMIYRSVDRGRTWSVDTDIGRFITLYDVTFSSQGLGIAVGDSGVILRHASAALALPGRKSRTGTVRPGSGSKTPKRFDSLGKSFPERKNPPTLVFPRP